MHLNARGLAILKHYEQGPDGGPALVSYRCPAGKWTLSWGCTDGVGPGMVISPSNAEKMLADALAPRERALTRLLGDAPTTDDQASALLLLLYNIGEANFAPSTLFAMHRRHDYAGAAKQFSRWNKGHVNGDLVVLPGLVKRRADEAALYLSKAEAMI